VALADRGGVDLAGPEAVLVEVGAQRIEDEQRLACARRRPRRHDVVRRARVHEAEVRAAATLHR
jgi:hypothetical protein